jgi:hypothetical protein
MYQPECTAGTSPADDTRLRSSSTADRTGAPATAIGCRATHIHQTRGAIPAVSDPEPFTGPSGSPIGLVNAGQDCPGSGAKGHIVTRSGLIGSQVGRAIIR